MKKYLIIILLLCCSFTQPTKRIGILFFNNCQKEQQAQLINDIQSFYYSKITIISPVNLPSKSFYPSRNRYRADSILDYLSRNKPYGLNIISITTRDISCTNGSISDWGVLGLGDLYRGVSVTSTFRMRGHSRNEFYNLLLGTILHEIGHTYGLDHCSNQRCLMVDAEGRIKKCMLYKPWMCPICRKKIGLPI